MDSNGEKLIDVKTASVYRRETKTRKSYKGDHPLTEEQYQFKKEKLDAYDAYHLHQRSLKYNRIQQHVQAAIDENLEVDHNLESQDDDIEELEQALMRVKKKKPSCPCCQRPPG